jgi:hypothetical protein
VTLAVACRGYLSAWVTVTGVHAPHPCGLLRAVALGYGLLTRARCAVPAIFYPGSHARVSACQRPYAQIGLRAVCGLHADHSGRNASDLCPHQGSNLGPADLQKLKSTRS